MSDLGVQAAIIAGCRETAKLVKEKEDALIAQLAIKETASGASIHVEDSAEMPIQNMVVRGKNLCSIYGFSAESITTPSSTLSKSNMYGTKIDSTSPSNSVKIIQTLNSGKASDSYKNGYFNVGVNDLNTKIENGYKCLSFDFTIDDNPLNSNTINCYVNGSGVYTVFKFDNTANSVHVTFSILKNVVNEKCFIEIRNNGISGTFSNFQLEKDDFTPYEPYKKDIDVTVCGKNLVKNISISTQENGITFTCNSNGTVTTNGTALAQRWTPVGKVELKKGVRYILNGSPANGSTSSYNMAFSGVHMYDTGSGLLYTPKVDETRTVTIYFNGGTNSDGLTFKPMVSISNNIDSSYEPYRAQTAKIDTETQTGWENLKTYYPVTNIIPSVNANIDCTYIADAKKYIDNQILELTANTVDLATQQMLDN